MQTSRTLAPVTLREWILIACIAVALTFSTIRLIGVNSNSVFSSVGSAIGNDGPSGSVTSTVPTASTEVHKLLRKGAMSVVVKNPAEYAEKIRQLAENAGGYIVVSEIRATANATEASMTIRVPVVQFEAVRTEIYKLGLRVESDRQESVDVTKQHVDQEARLHNLHAQELQYLAILKQATTVKDMVGVAEKLNEVRGQIEEQQAEFNTLSKQVETVELLIALRTEPLVTGWRPWFYVKQSAHDGIEAVADYGAYMTWVLFYLPAAILWLSTFVIAIIAGWKALRWIGRTFFPSVKAAQV